ncbi:MAG: hypothetical protein ABF289_13985, partial [Clostridiales bacterium]
LFLWRNLVNQGVKIDFSLEQLLTYTYLGAIINYILIPQTPASSWLYEGLIINLYQRPMGILTHLTFQTIGKWIPQIIFYTLPMLILAPLFGVSLDMYSSWFITSMILCISLGFAIDHIFACFIIYMKSASWIAYTVRMAIMSLFSGSVIPFSILPWNLGEIMKYLPFGSLAGATLSIFTGMENPVKIICIQFIWNIALWPIAILIFKKSHERMVSYGG